MRRRLSPEGLDIRDGIPENWFSELVLWAGLAVLALPFAQRGSDYIRKLTADKVRAFSPPSCAAQHISSCRGAMP
jgi:hypothetical protein